MFCQASLWQHVLNAGIFILLENSDNQTGGGRPVLHLEITTKPHLHPFANLSLTYSELCIYNGMQD